MRCCCCTYLPAGILMCATVGSPKMFFHMVKTRQKQFELLKNGGKASKEDKKKH